MAKTILLEFNKSLFKKIKSGKTKEEWFQERKENEIKIFTKPPKEGQYLFDFEKMIGYFPNPKKSEAQTKLFNSFVQHGLSVPLIEDTEFTSHGNILNPESRTHLTTQIKGIADNAPTRIYSNHPEILACKLIGAKKPKFELHSLDYIVDLGYKISDFQSCHPWEAQNLPPLILTKYSHFALAELLMVCHGDFQKAVLEKVKNRQISMTRRMFASTKIDNGTRDFVDFDWKVKIEGYWFKIRIRWIDTCALHGVASYEGIASASGTELPHKKILDDLKDKKTGEVLTKADMLKIALQYPEEFKLYAEGDLKVYDILVNNNEQMQKVYEGMGLKMKKAPKLTIGGTVKDLFETALEKTLLGNLSEKEIEDNSCKINQVINNFIIESTANNLKLNSWDTKALLAKVEGGRCRNHQPIMISNNGLWIDIDIKGCYGEGQRNQIYPIGNPVIFSYSLNKARNGYISLRKWLKQMKWGTSKNDLVPGAWVARISSNGELKYSQDFFASWFLASGTGVDILAKYVREKMKSDTEIFAVEDTHLDTDDGELKILENEIHNAVLTHDGLQWIMNIASKRQKNELLDNLIVLSSMHYPASQRIDENSEKPLLELIEKYKTWDGVNKTYYDAKTCKVVRVENQPHAWIGLNLGEVIINKLLENRGLAKFEFGKKSPLEQMYKLCTNTLYGDLVSKFFAISNTCAGNNITARARSLAWYMEKGLYGVQSITDGCGFNPNKVLFAGRDKVNGECVAMHRQKIDFEKGRLRLSGLGGSKWKGDEKGLYRDGEYIGKGADNTVINKLAMEHLQQLFPNVDVLHAPTESLDVIDGHIVRTPRIGQFSFEVKDIYKSIASHGSANYKFVSFTGESIYKCRGYESKLNHTGLIENEEIVNRYGDKAPIIDFLDQIEKSPESVKRQNVALKQGILKIGEYLESQSRYDALGLMPGDNTSKSLLVVEFSISQFTFKTHKQYKMWKTEVEKLKEKTGQSLEVFFLNKDGTLNYQRMVETIDQMIADDVVSPLKHLDPQNHRNRKGCHPAKQVLDEFRNKEPIKKESVPEPETTSVVFEGVKLNTCAEFDELFGFDTPEHEPETNSEVFEGVKLNTSAEFDELFGFN